MDVIIAMFAMLICGGFICSLWKRCEDWSDHNASARYDAWLGGEGCMR